ncbi:MAG: hypothetical protein ACRD0K_19870 [Egibacteraceae bacterium]
MDGLTSLAVAHILKPFTSRLTPERLSEFERSVVADILCDRDCVDPDTPAYRFHCNVTDHTRRFLHFWRSPPLRNRLFQAMISGNMTDLCAHMAAITSTPGAWSKLFMSADWIPSRPHRSSTCSGSPSPCHFATKAIIEPARLRSGRSIRFLTCT